MSRRMEKQLTNLATMCAEIRIALIIRENLPAESCVTDTLDALSMLAARLPQVEALRRRRRKA